MSPDPKNSEYFKQSCADPLLLTGYKAQEYF